MKILRYFAAFLMLASAIWHGVLAFQAAASRPMLAFAVAYLIVGVLLMQNKKPGFYLGVVFPLAGILAASIKFGWENFDFSLTILVIIDILVILTCILCIIYPKKTMIQT